MGHRRELANMTVNIELKNQAINETKVIVRTSSMITVRCVSVNWARAVVHELDAEARVRARTLQSAGNN